MSQQRISQNHDSADLGSSSHAKSGQRSPTKKSKSILNDPSDKGFEIPSRLGEKNERDFNKFKTMKIDFKTGTVTGGRLQDPLSYDPEKPNYDGTEVVSCKLKLKLIIIVDSKHHKRLIEEMRGKNLAHPSEWRNIPKCVVLCCAALLMRMDQIEKNEKDFMDN